MCELVLDALVKTGFLCLKSDGTYVRLTEGSSPRPRPVKATVRSIPIVITSRRRYRPCAFRSGFRIWVGLMFSLASIVFRRESADRDGDCGRDRDRDRQDPIVRARRGEAPLLSYGENGRQRCYPHPGASAYL